MYSSQTLKGTIEAKFKHIKFLPEIGSAIEEEIYFPPRIEKDRNEKILHEANVKEGVYKAIKPIGASFKAFIDGSYRIAKAGSFSGVPLYIASTAVVLAGRNKAKYLEEIGPNKHFNLVLFPFYIFEKKFFNEANGTFYNLCKDYLKIKYDAISDLELKENLIDVITGNRKDIWVYCDISFNGLSQNIESIELDYEKMFDDGKIRNKVHSRVRFIMSIIEAAYLKLYRDKKGQDEWVLIDGTLDHIVKMLFPEYQEIETYRNYYKNVVGFIKNIRRNPNVDLLKIYSLKENHFIISKGIRKDDDPEAEKEMVIEKNGMIFKEATSTGKEDWGFIYIRFRLPPEYRRLNYFVLPKGIVKLQFLASGLEDYKIIEKAKLIAGMVSLEKFPLPKDRFRIWNEASAIEETEKIAKSRLRSPQWLQHKGLAL